MEIYRVASRIDRAEATYFPEGEAEHGTTIQSAGTGKQVPVDATGYIEVPEGEVAALLAAGAIKPLDLEIAALEEKRDKAVEEAKRAQEELEKRRALLSKVIARRAKSGVKSTEQAAVAQSQEAEAELAGAGAKAGRK